MTQKVERFENYRNLINLCYLVGFGLFLGVQTLGSIMTLPRVVNALQIIAVPLMLLWGVGLWRYTKAVKADRALAHALGDELNRYTRNRVIITTFWALIVTQVVILVTSSFASFSAEAAANFTIFVMVMSWGMASLYLNRSDA